VLNHFVVDPLNLNQESSKLLAKLLAWRKGDGIVLSRGKIYFAGFNLVTLTNDIVVRRKPSGEWCYDVLDDHDCGEGKFGSAYKILAVLNWQLSDTSHRGEIEVSRKQKRVYKIQKNAAINEFSLMERCPHLRARLLYSGMPSMISMKQFPGVQFNDLLNQERSVKPFTHSERYRITIALLRALKKQIHDNMICHRDIKPDNIFYNPDTQEINIFDLGVSRLIGINYDRRSRGNAVFSAPEDFTCVITQKPITANEFRSNSKIESMASVKSDIYSMARVIGLVWRDKDPIFFLKKADHSKLMMRRITLNWVPQYDLFQNLNSVSIDERHAIENMLRQMTALNPDERPNLESCITVFENLYLEYKLTKISPENHPSIRAAHNLAREVREGLDEIEIYNSLCIRLKRALNKFGIDNSIPVSHFEHSLRNKFNSEYKVLADELTSFRKSNHIPKAMRLHELLDSLSEYYNLDTMIQYLLTEIEKLEDHPNAVAEFIETLDIKCLHGLSTKAQLCEMIQIIHDEFNAALTLYFSILGEAEHQHDEARMASLIYVLGGIYRDGLSLDHIKESAKHLSRKLQKLELADRHLRAPAI